MIIFLVFGLFILLPGCFFAGLAILGMNPGNLDSTVGELKHKKGYKQYKLKNRTVANATEYTYTYTVNGKVYSLRGERLMRSQNLRKRMSIVYLRCFPRCAYEDKFTGIAEWLIGGSLIVLGSFCLALFFTF